MATKRERDKAAKLERLAHANALIQVISKHGRRFFYCKSTDRVASLTLDAFGRVIYHDDFTGKAVYTPYSGRWSGFSHGGTLRSLIELMARYVARGIPLGRWVIGPVINPGRNIWGYPAEAMDACRAEAYALPMFKLE